MHVFLGQKPCKGRRRPRDAKFHSLQEQYWLNAGLSERVHRNPATWRTVGGFQLRRRHCRGSTYVCRHDVGSPSPFSGTPFNPSGIRKACGSCEPSGKAEAWGPGKMLAHERVWRGLGALLANAAEQGVTHLPEPMTSPKQNFQLRVGTIRHLSRRLEPDPRRNPWNKVAT